MADGLIPDTAWRAIAARYPRDDARPSLAITTFYALGGALLAAAVFALWGVLEINDVLPADGRPVWLFFLAFTALWAIGGTAAREMGNPELSMALFLAALIQGVALVGPDPGADALFLVPVVFAAGVLTWHGRHAIVATAALVVLEVTGAVALERLIADDGWSTLTWTLFATASLAAVLVWGRRADIAWRWSLSAVAAAATAIAWIFMVEETVASSFGFDGRHEVFIGLGLGAMLGVGLALRDRAMLYVAGLGLTADAVVFAFDVGGVTWGLVTLIVLSGSLIALATWLRRRQVPASAGSAAR